MRSQNGDAAGGISGLAAKQACTVLYADMPRLDSASLRAVLQTLVGPCSVEWARASVPDTLWVLPLVGGVAQFGPHNIAMIALNAPVREEVLARTVGVSPMPPELRAELLGHKAAIRLLYTGEADEPVEQLTALYRLAGALLLQGGLGLLNERAALALPAELALESLPQLGSTSPPLSLWVGVVTFGPEDNPTGRYLMRTYGMEQLGLTELALFIKDRAQADDVYHTLMNVCLYMVETSSRLHVGVGERAEFKGRTFLFTDPPEGGPEFSSPTGLLMLIEV